MKSLIEGLSRFPDEALCHACEGEITGIVILHQDRQGVIHRGEREDAEPEPEPETWHSHPE